MSKIVAIQMDPLANINVVTDTSFALGLAAQQRGYRLFVYQPENLTYRSPTLLARGHFVEFIDSNDHFYRLQSFENLDLAKADYVLIRQDPPYNLAYITTTHLLELLPASTKITFISASRSKSSSKKSILAGFKSSKSSLCRFRIS